MLLLSHAVDNFVVTSLPEFDGKRLQSVAQGAPDFGSLTDEAEKEAAEKAGEQFAGLVSRLKEALAGQAWDVRLTSRLTTSPACIVANEAETDFSLFQRLRGSGLPSQPVLEINPQHPLVRRLNRDLADRRLTDWANVLYSQAVLTLGARIEDPASFVTRLNDLLVALADETENPATENPAAEDPATEVPAAEALVDANAADETPADENAAGESPVADNAPDGGPGPQPDAAEAAAPSAGAAEAESVT